MGEGDGHYNNSQPGMSLHDYFAGQALAGVAARMSSTRFDDIRNGDQDGRIEARVALILADAMLNMQKGTE
jgi:hypothetical protein